MKISAAQFVVCGLALAGIIFFGRKALRDSVAKQYAGATTSALLGVGITLVGAILLFILSPPATLAGATWYKESPVGEILLFVVMLIGMMASYLTKQIEARRVRMEEKKKVGDVSRTGLNFDLWEFTYPMLVSVITFGAVLQGVGTKAIDVQAVILSFQTGFFWQTILARSKPS
ncbi:hypothetical protein Q3C01_44145 [Bradyrhizobium sp. UFLA05-109]